MNCQKITLCASLLILAAVSAVKAEPLELKITTNWSYSATHTGNGPFGTFIPGSTFSVPRFSPMLGDLDHAAVSLDGTWNISARQSEEQIEGVGGASVDLRFFDVSDGFYDPENFRDDFTEVLAIGTSWLKGEQGGNESGRVVSLFGGLSWSPPEGDHSFIVGAGITPNNGRNEEGELIPNTVNFDAQGILQTTYVFEPTLNLNETLAPIRPIVISDLSNGNLLGDFPPNLAIPAGAPDEPIGAVEEVQGEVSVTRADGTQERLSLGTPIFEGDVITSENNGQANIFFTDETSLAIGENANLSIEDHGANSSSQGGFTNIPTLRDVFVFVSDLISRDDSGDIINQGPTVSLGIRGDVRDIIREDLLNNPQPELGDAGIWIETASPVGVSIFMPAPVGPTTIAFEAAFLSDEGTFSIELGGVELFALDATPERVGQRESHEVQIELSNLPPVSELSFMLDGPTDNAMVMWDISVNGVLQKNYELFGRKGSGPVETVLIATPEQLSEINSRLANARGKLLSPNRWEQISIPAAALGAASIETLFADDLDMASYGESWVVFGYDTRSGSYYEVPTFEPLSVGAGYWIIQTTDQDVFIDLPEELNEDNRFTSSGCPATEGCYEASLVNEAEQIRDVYWNMSGNPVSTHVQLGQTLLAYSDAGGADAGVVESFLSAADEAKIADRVWHYNSSTGGYIEIGSESLINVWDGFWMPLVHDNTLQAEEIRLLWPLF